MSRKILEAKERLQSVRAILNYASKAIFFLI